MIALVLLCSVMLAGCGSRAPIDPNDAALAALLIGYLIGRIIHRRPRT